MTECPTHGRNCRKLAPRRDPKDDENSDGAVDEEAEGDLGEDEDDEDEGDEELAEDDAPPEAEAAQSGTPRRSWRERMRRRARGHGGMGRRSTGPTPRPSSAPLSEARVSAEAVSAVEASAELAPDVTTWPGTAEAARIVGRHASTIKLWRAQGRIRAVQDGSGCWRHHPDDLAEAVDTPDQTDPGTVLAQGMTAIVAQGSSANERLLTMTEIATSGLQTATGVLSTELERAYAKIADLEAKVAELTEKLAATRELDLKHERYMRRLDMKHELELVGSKETSERLNGLLTIVGPIAASMAARLLNNIGKAEHIEAKAAGASGAPEGPLPESPDARYTYTGPATPPPPSSPSSTPSSTAITPQSPEDDRLVPIETRITDAMSRLAIAIRTLDGPAFRGFRAMMPPNIQAALDDVMEGSSDSAVGQALAALIQAAQNLSDLQFTALKPIAPADVAAVLAELRQLIRVEKDTPS